MLWRGDREAEGDEILTELARRGGATPFTECREFIEALRSRPGVPARDAGRPPSARGLRGAAPRTLKELGDLEMLMELGER